MKPARCGACTLLLLALTIVGAPGLVEAQEPIPLPPEGEELVDPLGSDACATAGFGSVIFVAVVLEGGLDPSTADPFTDAVGQTCESFAAPDDTVICPADDELQNQIFALPTQEVAPLPPPPVTIFGASVETLRAVAALADQSPDIVNPVAALLNCTTVPGHSGAPGPLPPPTQPPPSTTSNPTPPPTPGSTAPVPSSRPVPSSPDEVAVAPAPAVPSNSALASFVPFAPTVPLEAQMLAVVAAVALLATARSAWRRAGQRAVAAVTRSHLD